MTFTVAFLVQWKIEQTTDRSNQELSVLELHRDFNFGAFADSG
jgi:hypothetical protein